VNRTPFSLLRSAHPHILSHVCVCRSEWATSQHRDTCASHLGHYETLSYFAVAQVSALRERARFLPPPLVFSFPSLGVPRHAPEVREQARPLDGWILYPTQSPARGKACTRTRACTSDPRLPRAHGSFDKLMVELFAWRALPRALLRLRLFRASLALQNDSIGRVRYQLLEKMLQPCGPPPEKEEEE